jgi:hypothetical protein
MGSRVSLGTQDGGDRFQPDGRFEAEGACIPHRVLGEDFAEAPQFAVVHDVAPQGQHPCYFDGVLVRGFHVVAYPLCGTNGFRRR